MVRRKHEESCGRGVPALKSVGVACVNSFCDLCSNQREKKREKLVILE
jgi:hypothetical protein